MAVILAVLGALLVAVGCALTSLPLGLLVAGGECIAAAYVIAYLTTATDREVE